MSKPLTIEELKALQVGDWVWVVDELGYCDYAKKIISKDIQGIESFMRMEYCQEYYLSDYGTKWLAYKNKEQAETEGEWVELPRIEPFETCYIGTGEPCVCYNILYRDKASGELVIDCKGDKSEAEARLKELRGEK